MNFITLSSSFSTRFPWFFKINLLRLLLEDNILTQKKWIFLNMPVKLVLRIRNFIKMQRNLKNFLHPARSSENTGLPQFFSKFFWQLYFKNINFLTKTKKCLLCWLLWIQNYQMTGKYLTSNTTFSKKVNPMKYRRQTYILARTWNLLFMCFTVVYIQLDHDIY